MFTLHSPLPALETLARRGVYREHVERHRELQHVTLGCHNDMVMLATDAATGGAVAVLVATGKPGQRVEFPRHRHSKGEWSACLEGHYGEYLVAGADVTREISFETATTLAQFQREHPGLVELRPAADGKVPVLLGPGAVWSMGEDSVHQPFGYVGPSGLLLAQIRWPGPNEVLA